MDGNQTIFPSNLTGLSTTGLADNTTGTNITDMFDAINVSTTLAPGVGPRIVSWQYLIDNFYTASYIIVPILLVTGLTGNALTICIMASKSFTSMTSRYILIALALSDTTLLLTQPFNKLFVRKLLGTDVRAISDFGCKAFFHIFKTGKMTSSWLIVILCFERFIAVVFPLRTKTIITKKTILILIAIDYVFIVTYNAIWTFSSLIVDGVCKPDVVTPETKQRYRDFLLAGSSFYSLIPMILMAILTPIIVYKLIQQHRKRKSMSSSTSNSESDTVRISAMLIGVVVAYVTCILPITIVHNLAFWRNVSAFDTNTQGFFILREVAQILEQLNYSTNFILYVLCSNRFRQKAAELLRLDKFRQMKLFSSKGSSSATGSAGTKQPLAPGSSKEGSSKEDDKA